MREKETNDLGLHRMNVQVKKAKDNYKLKDMQVPKKDNSQLYIREIADKKNAYNVFRLFFH